MTLFQAILIGGLYYYANSAWIASQSLYTLQRPLVAGPIVGLIMGDIKTGLEMGLLIQFIYMGYMNTGGSQPSDPALAGMVGTALAILLKPQMGEGALEAALTLSVALGIIGVFRNVGRMTLNSFFIRGASAAASKGDTNGLYRWHIIYPQLLMFAMTFVPVVIFLMTVGDDSIIASISRLLQPMIGPLQVVAALLPTVGIAITLNAIGTKKTLPFFFLGFVLSQYLKIDIIGITILGVIMAYLIGFVGQGAKEELATASADADDWD